MTWARQGLLLQPPSDGTAWVSHAQAPTPLIVSDRCWRIYFGGRDAENRSHIHFADFDPRQDFRLLRLETRPVLSPGGPGDFDVHGVGPAAALSVDGQVWMYYSGIALRRDVPYQVAIGLAVSDDGGLSFRRACRGPVMAVGPVDPYFVSMPSVWRESSGFRAVYSSATRWVERGARWECCYELRSAASDDGLHWQPHPEPALSLVDGEAGLGRQCVLPQPEGLRMWFSHRGMDGFRGAGEHAYRIQPASSSDGRLWRRSGRDVVWAPPPRQSEWDSWMQAYPSVMPLDHELIMFYNGNDFGRGGFGWARSPQAIPDG